MAVDPGDLAELENGDLIANYILGCKSNYSLQQTNAWHEIVYRVNRNDLGQSKMLWKELIAKVNSEKVFAQFSQALYNSLIKAELSNPAKLIEAVLVQDKLDLTGAHRKGIVLLMEKLLSDSEYEVTSENLEKLLILCEKMRFQDKSKKKDWYLTDNKLNKVLELILARNAATDNPLNAASLEKVLKLYETLPWKFWRHPFTSNRNHYLAGVTKDLLVAQDYSTVEDPQIIKYLAEHYRAVEEPDDAKQEQRRFASLIDTIDRLKKEDRDAAYLALLDQIQPMQRMDKAWHWFSEKLKPAEYRGKFARGLLFGAGAIVTAVLSPFVLLTGIGTGIQKLIRWGLEKAEWLNVTKPVNYEIMDPNIRYKLISTNNPKIIAKLLTISDVRENIQALANMLNKIPLKNSDVTSDIYLKITKAACDILVSDVNRPLIQKVFFKIADVIEANPKLADLKTLKLLAQHGDPATLQLVLGYLDKHGKNMNRYQQKDILVAMCQNPNALQTQAGVDPVILTVAKYAKKTFKNLKFGDPIAAIEKAADNVFRSLGYDDDNVKLSFYHIMEQPWVSTDERLPLPALNSQLRGKSITKDKADASISAQEQQQDQQQQHQEEQPAQPRRQPAQQPRRQQPPRQQQQQHQEEQQPAQPRRQPAQQPRRQQPPRQQQQQHQEEQQPAQPRRRHQRLRRQCQQILPLQSEPEEHGALRSPTVAGNQYPPPRGSGDLHDAVRVLQRISDRADTFAHNRSSSRSPSPSGKRDPAA